MGCGSHRPARRGFDPITFVLGLGALFVAAVGFSDDPSWVSTIDPRWLLAGGAVLVGVLLLIGTLRRPRNENGRSQDSAPTG
jgi:hypothetical protein